MSKSHKQVVAITGLEPISPDAQSIVLPPGPLREGQGQPARELVLHRRTSWGVLGGACSLDTKKDVAGNCSSNPLEQG